MCNPKLEIVFFCKKMYLDKRTFYSSDSRSSCGNVFMLKLPTSTITGFNTFKHREFINVKSFQKSYSKTRNSQLCQNMCLW